MPRKGWSTVLDGCSSSAVDEVARQRSSVFEATSERPPWFTGHASARGQSPRTVTRGHVSRQGSSDEIGGGNGSSGRDGPHFHAFARGIEERKGLVSSPSRGGSHCIIERIYRAGQEEDCCVSSRSQSSAGGSCEGAVEVAAGGARLDGRRGTIGDLHAILVQAILAQAISCSRAPLFWRGGSGALGNSFFCVFC